MHSLHEVEGDTTIEKIIKKALGIEERKDKNTREICFVTHNGKTLDNHFKTIHDYDIKQNDTIKIRIKGMGGSKKMEQADMTQGLEANTLEKLAK